MARVSRKKALEKRSGQADASTKGIYHAAVYVRLSVKDNNRTGDGESIAAQRYQLEKFVEGQEDMRLCGVFEDNGETGTNFSRPGFEGMIEKVYSRQIDCIVVKDLSRFGRNYVETGYYLEEVFNRLGVRFVAVNDGLDTLRETDGIGMAVSLKNLVNDLYARDISQKTSSALLEKQKKGEFIGNSAPYGYSKAKEDKHRLVINPETAPVVREIFSLRLKGWSFAEIARSLNDREVLCPGMYLYMKGEKKKQPFGQGALWQTQTVRRIITNPVYIGHMAQGKRRQSLSDGKKAVTFASEDWILVENTHEAIIEREDYERVGRSGTQAGPARQGKE